MTGSRNAQTGERLLQDNFRNIVRVKDWFGRNLLEQVAAYYAYQNENFRGRASLCGLGEMLEKQADLLTQTRKISFKEGAPLLTEAGILKAKAIDAFKSLPDPAKRAVCKIIWELDGGGDKGNDYGYHTIVADIEKLLSHKNTCPIKDALRICGENLTKEPTIQASYLNTENIRPNDSRATVQEIKKVYELEDLKRFINDSDKNNDFLVEKYLNLNPEMGALLNRAIWIASYKPHALGDFSKNHVCRDVRVLSYMKNQQDVDILSQLISHQQEKIKAQRLITEIETFVLDATKKISGGEILTLFNALSDTAKEYMRGRVWKRDGGNKNPHFGGPGYGTRTIEKDPYTLYVGNSDAPINVNAIIAEIKNADSILLQDLEAHKVIPEDPIDVSSSTLQRDPNLKDWLPKNLRVTHVTAELSGVATIGGLASAVEGMVRAFGTKDARVVMPLYRGSPISNEIFKSLKPKPEYNVTVNRETHRVFKADVKGIKVYFIDDPALFYVPPKPKDGTAGNFYHGNPNDDDHTKFMTVKRRWAVFPSAAAEVVNKFYNKKNPFQLVHCHDAQTALVPKFLAMRPRHVDHPPYYGWRRGETPATVFTFHNVNDPNCYDNPEACEILKQHGLPGTSINPIVEGLDVADVSNTVSNEYSKNVQTKTYGNGMDPAFKKAGLDDRFFGIVNGNSNGWDPTQDEQLRTWVSVQGPTQGTVPDLRYGPDSPDLAEKIKTIQRELCAYLKSLPRDDDAYADLDPEKPIELYVGRFDWNQKGVDKFKMIMEETLKNGGQFVCVGVEAGEPGSPSYEMLKDLKNFAKAHNNKGILVLEDSRVNGRLKYQQNKFGSLLRAACALAIFPSFFEPCGLVQGELMKYGKKVIATKTGGFVDTIKTEGPDANGYLFNRHENWWFNEAQDKDIRDTIRIALKYANDMQYALYHRDANAQKPYLDLMRTTMRNELNSTWEKTYDGSLSPIGNYYLLYAKAFQNRKQHRGLLDANLKTYKV